MKLKIKHLKIFSSNRILDPLLTEWISSAIVEFNLFLRPTFIFAWGCLYLFDLLVLKRKFWHLHDDLLSQLLPYLTYVSYWSNFYLVNSSRVLLNLMGGSPTLIKYICEHFFSFCPQFIVHSFLLLDMFLYTARNKKSKGILHCKRHEKLIALKKKSARCSE